MKGIACGKHLRFGLLTDISEQILQAAICGIVPVEIEVLDCVGD